MFYWSNNFRRIAHPSKKMPKKENWHTNTDFFTLLANYLPFSLNIGEMSFESRGTSREEGEMRRSFEQLADEQHELAQEAEEQEANDQILDKFFATKSEKGKDMLRRNGYEYIFDKASKTADGEFWKCPKKPYCPGRIIVQIHWQQGEGGGQKFKVGKALNEQHNHASIDPSVRDAQNYLRLAAQAEQPHNTRRAVDMARQQMATGVCAQNVPSSSTMARAYRNYIAKSKKPTKPKQTANKSIKVRKAQGKGAELPAGGNSSAGQLSDE